jgi:predicted ribonuclease YlaK
MATRRARKTPRGPFGKDHPSTERAGHIAVLDSNVLLHHLPPDQVNWQAATERPLVRLILPLRVVEELDSKKYGPSDRLRERARRCYRSWSNW